MARNRKSGRKTWGKTHRRRNSGDRNPSVWLYGVHAVIAALSNPARICERVLVSDEELAAHAVAAAEHHGARVSFECVSRDDVGSVLPSGAVHQGIALLTQPLPDPGLEAAIDRALAMNPPCILVLDQVTDPQNVGAIMRSAGAFGASAIVMQDRHAPLVTGALAKAASGGLETVDLVRETNLVRSLEALKARDFWCIGLNGEAKRTLAEARVTGPTTLVLGAEGSGLRRLVSETCDALARIPQRSTIESLNVSNAAAVALYEVTRTA
ncbi:MAG: 23S rRNA (guanosine(2251)-2'-O)-methyltransferase RlmB [Alphaproteobacteria bacterium]|nr:23S rRNA (guanosine(2251)-2'-O)-methyltransferase RlmB [Alphaproteobacteria bacterium]|tara:strand:+ start:242 stop:1045 length:804 start_codon:yes stop_codon:yes gene_type:complete